MITRITGSKPRFLALLAATVSVAVAACGNFTGVPASIPTLSDSGVVYAINGAPPGAPTALHVFSGTLLAADASFLFDVAFDLDSAGNVVYRPVSTIASGLAGSHSVGLQTSTESYDAIERAPGSGYHADTALVTRPNVAVLVQSHDTQACGVSLTGSTLYAKIVVTAVDPVSRQLKVRYTVDSNCGFRSFASGVPKD
ncbi:MAG TPA: hypothetical protein VHB25_05760 [Gemmatimonadaceae bacterium]|nr:hypothetical protein [Gemmatimonadaceae bacterium]